MKKLLIIILPVLLLSNCKHKEDIPVVPPFATTLISPVQNEVCNQGVVTSPTESTVTLKWNSSLATDSYEVDVKNLLTGAITTLNTNDIQIDVPLLRNTPYSWFVVSKSTATSITGQSNIWKFYNSGPATVSYAPFPADITSPTFGQVLTVTTGKVNLTWTGNDVDNDIVSYAVYFGTTVSPVLLKSSITDMFLNDVAVTANTTYYWKIVTTDAKGNVSDSGVAWFKVK